VIQRVLLGLHSAERYPITVVRVLIGAFFCISGGTKLFVPAKFSIMQQTMISSHIPFPHASALFVSSVEFICGAGLILGFLTLVCAGLLSADMIVAIATNRLGNLHTSGLGWLDDILYLPEVLYVLILLWLLFSGPGPYSVDALLAARERRSQRPPGGTTTGSRVT